MTDKSYQTPAVHAGLAKIMREISVEKNGTLPGNMGGKSYVTAADLSNEVKRLFTDNNMILIPSEKVIDHKVTLTQNQKTIVAISVEGSYTAISTEDGSSVTFGASGDGLATGSAVASNIASTNALKNALLRLFLATEQSVEEQSKQEQDTGGAPAQSGPSPSVAAIKERLKQKSQAVEGDVKGSKYLEMIVDSGSFGKSFTDLWKSGSEAELLKLEALVDEAAK